MSHNNTVLFYCLMIAMADLQEDEDGVPLLLASCKLLERQFNTCIHNFSLGQTRQRMELQFYMAREALGFCLDGVTYEQRDIDPSLEFLTATVIERTEGTTGGAVEVKLYSRYFDRYEAMIIPYCEKAGFSYGVWADRLRHIEHWFDEHAETSQVSPASAEQSIGDTDDEEAEGDCMEEEEAFMLMLRPYPGYFQRFYMGDDLQSDTLDRMKL